MALLPIFPKFCQNSLQPPWLSMVISLALLLLGSGGVIWLHKQRGSFLNGLLVGEDGDVKASMLQSAHGQARIFLVLTFLHQPVWAKDACVFTEITFPSLDQVAHVFELLRLDNARAFGCICKKHQLQTSQRKKLELTLVELGTSKKFMLVADQHRKFTKPLLPSLKKTCFKTMYPKKWSTMFCFKANLCFSQGTLCTCCTIQIGPVQWPALAQKVWTWMAAAFPGHHLQ